MSIERIYYCDGPSCADDSPGESTVPHRARTATPPPHLPSGFIELRERGDLGDRTWHFCSHDCLMKFAAKHPPTEYFSFPDGEPLP